MGETRGFPVDNVQIGFVGAGNWAVNRARRFNTIEGVHVTIGWSRSERCCERFRREIGARATENWLEVCESEQVDAVVVSTPHVFHFEQARAALANGKHVLVETPLCLHYSQARQLADLGAQGDLVIHHGASFRHHPDYARGIEHLRSVGPLLYAERLAAFEGGPQRPWYRDFALSGGAFSFVSFEAIEFFEAFGHVAEVDGWDVQRGKLDVATMWVRFVEGGQARVSYGTGENVPSVGAGLVIGTDGAVQWGQGLPRRLIRGGEVTDLPKERELDVVLRQCEIFVDQIRRRRDFHADLDLDLRVLKAVSEAQEKAQNRRDREM